MKYTIWMVIIILLALSPGYTARRNISLEEEVRNLQARIELLETMVFNTPFYLTSVTLDPSSPGGFQCLGSPVGVFLISLGDIKPYLDGYKVTVKIGNPYFATFSSFSIQVEWGEKVPNLSEKEAFDKFLAWEKTIRRKTFSFPQNLTPGTWTSIELVLTPAPKKLGYLRLSNLQISSVALLKQD